MNHWTDINKTLDFQSSDWLYTSTVDYHLESTQFDIVATSPFANIRFGYSLLQITNKSNSKTQNSLMLQQ